MLAILGYLWQYTIDKYLRDYYFVSMMRTSAGVSPCH